MEPFVIIVKNDEDSNSPDVEVKVTAADPLDAVTLAGRVIDLFKTQFETDPIVEIQPLAG